MIRHLDPKSPHYNPEYDAPSRAQDQARALFDADDMEASDILDDFKYAAGQD